MQDITANGIALLCEFEGFKALPYADVAGNWTVGYGTKITAAQQVKYADGISPANAQLLLIESCKQIQSLLPPLDSLFSYQQDALYCLVYNIGVSAFKQSTIFDHLLKRNTDLSPWKWWNKAGGHILSDLVQRRDRELRLFIYGVYK
jgi:lysozyme